MDRIEGTCCISTQDLLVLGLNHVAYVKPMVDQHRCVYEVHGADGTLIAELPTMELAYAVTWGHGLELVTLQ